MQKANSKGWCGRRGEEEELQVPADREQESSAQFRKRLTSKFFSRRLKFYNRRKSEEERTKKDWLGLESWQHFLQLLVQKASCLVTNTREASRRVWIEIYVVGEERQRVKIEDETKLNLFGLEMSAKANNITEQKLMTFQRLFLWLEFESDRLETRARHEVAP